MITGNHSHFSAGPCNITFTGRWSFFSAWNITTTIIVAGFNMATLVYFLTNRDLRKLPFSIYLMCLMASNIALVVLHNPLELIDRFYPVCWIGRTFCIVYNYAISSIPGCQMHSHALITISRIWAVTFPISYRRLHTRSVAAASCLSMVIYVHLVQMPQFVLNVLKMRRPLEVYGCRMRLSTQQFLMIAMIPWAIIIGGYPFIIYQRRRLRISRKRVLPISVLLQGTDVATTGLAETGRARASANRDSRSSTILTLLTCSTLVFWSPVAISHSIASFATYSFPIVTQISVAMFSMQAIVDPILFSIALRRPAIRWSN